MRKRVPILGEEHVLGKDVHAIDPFLSETSSHCCERWSEILLTGMVSVKVLLQWTALDSAEAVGRERTREDAHTAAISLALG